MITKTRTFGELRERQKQVYNEINKLNFEVDVIGRKWDIANTTHNFQKMSHYAGSTAEKNDHCSELSKESMDLLDETSDMIGDGVYSEKRHLLSREYNAQCILGKISEKQQNFYETGIDAMNFGDYDTAKNMYERIENLEKRKTRVNGMLKTLDNKIINAGEGKE